MEFSIFYFDGDSNVHLSVFTNWILYTIWMNETW